MSIKDFRAGFLQSMSSGDSKSHGSDNQAGTKVPFDESRNDFSEGLRLKIDLMRRYARNAKNVDENVVKELAGGVEAIQKGADTAAAKEGRITTAQDSRVGQEETKPSLRR